MCLCIGAVFGGFITDQLQGGAVVGGTGGVVRTGMYISYIRYIYTDTYMCIYIYYMYICTHIYLYLKYMIVFCIHVYLCILIYDHIYVHKGHHVVGSNLFGGSEKYYGNGTNAVFSFVIGSLQVLDTNKQLLSFYIQVIKV